MKRPEQAARSALVATAGTAASRITGFMRTAAMAYALGVTESRLADTYNLANVTPNIIYELVLGGVLSSVLLRVYVEVRERDGDEAAWRFVTRVSNLAMVVMGAAIAAGIILAPALLHAYTFRTPGGEGERVLGTFLLRLFIPQILFYGFSTISTAVLQAHRRFGVSMFAPVANNLVVTGVFAAFALTVAPAARHAAGLGLGERLLLGLGTTAGVAVMGLVPWWYMRKAGYRRVRRAGLLDPDVRRLASLSAYTLGYVVTNQVGLWVALILANRVQGGVTAYTTAFVFFQLPHGLLAVSIAAAAGPVLAETAVAGNMEAFWERTVQGLRATAFLILPAGAGYLVLARPMIRLLLQHGIMTGRSTDLISLVLQGYAAGLIFFSAFAFLLRAFSALGNTRTPMLINMGGFAVNVVVDVALFLGLASPDAKVAGLAVGHSASYVFVAGAAYLVLRKAMGRLKAPGLASSLARSAAASVLTGLGAWAGSAAARQVMGDSIGSQAAQILVGTGVGLLIYLGAAKILGAEELEWLRGLGARRSR